MEVSGQLHTLVTFPLENNLSTHSIARCHSGKVLCYKSEGRWFDLEIFVAKILPITL